MKSIREIRASVRQYLVDQSRMEFDTRISHLIPEKNCNHALFFIFSEIRVKDKYRASNPFAICKVDIDDGRVLSFSNICDKEEDINWTEYEPKLLSEYQSATQELLEMYDELYTYFFKDKKELKESAIERLHKFSDLLKIVIVNEMMPHYLTFGADFFKWLEE